MSNSNPELSMNAHVRCRCAPLHPHAAASVFSHLLFCLSHLRLIRCARCRCFQCTPCKGPGSRTGWSCDANASSLTCSVSTFSTFFPHTDLLKEPIWRSLFITAPSTSPKKSPVWESSDLKNRTTATQTACSITQAAMKKYNRITYRRNV